MWNETINEQISMCVEDGVTREHHFVDGYMQNEHARPCIYDWAEVILELYDSCRVRHVKQIFVLLYAEKFERDGMWGTLQNLHACI